MSQFIFFVTCFILDFLIHTYIIYTYVYNYHIFVIKTYPKPCLVFLENNMYGIVNISAIIKQLFNYILCTILCSSNSNSVSFNCSGLAVIYCIQRADPGQVAIVVSRSRKLGRNVKGYLGPAQHHVLRAWIEKNVVRTLELPLISIPANNKM